MKLSELAQIEQLELVNEIVEDKEVHGITVGDLLSHVMANGENQALWITVQRHINVIAVAELNDFSAILFVEGVDPDQAAIDKANELGITLFKTSLSSIGISRVLIRKGL